MKRDKPSTKARKDGYRVLGRLRNLLVLLLGHKTTEDDPFNRGLGWKDYMVRHIPEIKRGGPAQPSKRKNQKRRDRQNTVR
jgi:hypothetical protein